MLQKLQDHNLYLKPAKCIFEQCEVNYLEVILRQGIVRMDLVKVKGVQEWQTPHSTHDVCSFLRFTGYYNYFIQNYATIARPLLELTCTNTPFSWSSQWEAAFQTLKQCMCQQPILCQANYTKPFFLATDALGYGMGAILLQEGDPKPHSTTKFLHPTAYYSATFTLTECNYDIYK